MLRTLVLAEKGRGKVSPNPMVGAILVKDGEIISEGYHHACGDVHAEIDCMRQADASALKDAELYVNLEPCSHQGKTPPCADAIIEAKIGHVVYGMKDPNPLVSGQGLKKLRNAGVKVTGPVLEDACRHLNRGFISTVTKQRPYITLKVAQTLDGKIALPNGESKWITGVAARKRVHAMRAEHDAVLVGSTTVLGDDPELTVRLTEGVNPKKIVLDSTLKTPIRSKIIQHHPESVILIHGKAADTDQKETLKQTGSHLIEAKQTESGVDLESVWADLIQSGVNSIFVEGGSKVFSAFLKNRWVDHLSVFIAPKLFGRGISAFDTVEINCPDKAILLSVLILSQVGDDLLFEGALCCFPA